MIIVRWPAALLILAVAAVPASAQVKFEWKFNKGDKFYQTTETTANQTITIGDKKFEQKTEQKVVSLFTVVDKAADGSVTLEQKIEDITAKAEGGNPGAVLAPLKDAVFKITLNPKMEVTKFEGYEEAMKKVAGADPIAAKMIRSILTEETMKKAAGESFGFLPAEPVAKDKTWERKLTIPLNQLGSIEATNLYKYVGPNGANEEIAVTSSFKYTPPAEDTTAGAPFTIKKDGSNLIVESSKGTVLFDNKTGRLVSSNLEMKMKGKLSIEAGGNKHVMDMEQTQVIKVTVTANKP